VNNVGTLLCNGNMVVTVPGIVNSISVNAFGSPALGVYPEMQVNVNGVVQGDWFMSGGTVSYAVNSLSDTHFYFADHLGTVSLIVNANGSVESKSEFDPYGVEVDGNAWDANHYKFTGKERDTESGLDDFGARYYSSNMGRFMSPDSPGFTHLSNPQAWNLYSYTYNNPISFVDPDGHDVTCSGLLSTCLADANTNAGGNVVATSTTTRHSYLFGLIVNYTTEVKLGIAPGVSEADFRAQGQNASRLADLIDNHSFTLNVDYGFDRKNPGGSDSFLLSNGAKTPGVVIDPSNSNGVHDPDALYNQVRPIPQANSAEEFGHEVLGHQWGELINKDIGGSTNYVYPFVPTSRANMRDSITGENAVRALDPTAHRGQKAINSHHNYPDAPSEGFKK
jgi:RHS repeat-associated protein